MLLSKSSKKVQIVQNSIVQIVQHSNVQKLQDLFSPSVWFVKQILFWYIRVPPWQQLHAPTYIFFERVTKNIFCRVGCANTRSTFLLLCAVRIVCDILMKKCVCTNFHACTKPCWLCKTCVQYFIVVRSTKVCDILMKKRVCTTFSPCTTFSHCYTGTIPRRYGSPVYWR